MNHILRSLVLLGLICLHQSAAALRVEGKVFRERRGGLELVVLSMISTNRTPAEVRQDEVWTVYPGDCINYSLFLKNVSDEVTRVISAPQNGIRDIARDFSFSCEPEYLEGGFVRTPPSVLAIVDLKPGELVSLGVVQYTCGLREVGENTFWYSISEVIGREYAVWSGSILCRAPFVFSGQEMKEGEPGATDNPDDAQR